MNLMQPWVLAASVLAGAGAGAAVASAWWGRELRHARLLIDQLLASRRQLEEQVSSARRQIEQLQVEMLELRLTTEHLRRKATTAERLSRTEWGDGMLTTQSAQMPLSVAPSAPRPSMPAAPRPSMPVATRQERARELVAAGGFAPTEPLERGLALGFLPTQADPAL